jgi:hypothetical protein
VIGLHEIQIKHRRRSLKILRGSRKVFGCMLVKVNSGMGTIHIHRPEMAFNTSNHNILKSPQLAVCLYPKEAAIP